jgi:hypothetical protein
VFSADGSMYCMCTVNISVGQCMSPQTVMNLDETDMVHYRSRKISLEGGRDRNCSDQS